MRQQLSDMRNLAALAAIVVTIIFAGLHVSSAQAQTKSRVMSAAAFAKQYIAYVSARAPDAKAKMAGRLKVAFKFRNGQTHTVDLSKHYKAYRKAPKTLTSILASAAGVPVGIASGRAIKLEARKIIPVLRNLDFIRRAERIAKGDRSRRIIFDQLNAELYVAYVFDLPNAIRYVTQRSLTNLKIPRERLKALALANLARAMPRVRTQRNRGLTILTGRSAYVSSLLLIDGLWTRRNFPFKGQLVAFVPARDMIFVTGTKEFAGLSTARSIAARAFKEVPNAISAKPFYRELSWWHLLTKDRPAPL